MAILRFVVDRRAALQDRLQLRGVKNLAGARGTPDLFGQGQARRGRRRRPCASARRARRRRAAASCPRPSRRGPTAFQSRRRRATETPVRARATAARALSSKDGFSVVAPTSTTVPSSITGQKRSCCARLKRWISSTNSSVPLPGLPPRARRVEHLLQIGDAGKHRRELLEMQFGRLGQQPRHGGLAGARRPPEDHRAERCASPAFASSAPSGRAGDPGRPPRASSRGRSLSASGRGASRSRPAAANRLGVLVLDAGSSQGLTYSLSLPAGSGDQINR